MTRAKLSRAGPQNGKFADLTGRRFGKLAVTSYAGPSKTATPVSLWVCRCDCGAEVTVPRDKLTSRDKSRQIHACPACRLARECVVCGAPFIAASARAITCSPACKETRRETTQKRRRQEYAAENPERIKAGHTRYRARRAEDPARDQAAKSYKRAWTKANRDKINLKRRDDLENDPDKRAAHRAYHRDYQRKLMADPKERAKKNERTTDWRRRKALNELVQIGRKLRGDNDKSD